MTSKMVKGGCWTGVSQLEEDLAERVFDIMTGKCTKVHTINAINWKSQGLTMMTPLGRGQK